MLIREPTPEEEVAFFGYNDPAIRDLRCAVIGSQVVAMAGVIRDPRYYGSIFEEDGRWIGFLQLASDAPKLGAMAVVAMRHYLKSQTDPIIVQWDDSYPTAEKLLRVLGFIPTEEFMASLRHPSQKLRIWLWQPSP
jgi:hypothetical protein